ncbi:MAG: glycoside hydrolase family 16 protein [Caulobacteraceae bacterium]
MSQPPVLGAAIGRRAALGAGLALALSPALARAEGPRPLARAPDGRPLELVFDEEFRRFDAGPSGRHVWRTVFGDGAQTGTAKRSLPSNGELELYVDPEFAQSIGAGDLDPFAVRDGTLSIVARPAPPAVVARGWRYVSGLITTEPSFAQTYGYFEARARLPAGKGLWPAIWMLPADGTWPPEIDIMESIGDPAVVYMSTHSKVEPAYTKKVEVSAPAFHTYAVSWDEHQLVWYVDGVEVSRRPTPADMHKSMYLLINLAVGGAWPGSPDASTPFPAAFSVSCVRGYRFA